MPKRSILILDDDATVGQTIRWIAESLDFEAEFVTRPHEFFQQLARMCPEFITIDLVMPELDGVEIMRLLAEHNARRRSSSPVEWETGCWMQPGDLPRSTV